MTVHRDQSKVNSDPSFRSRELVSISIINSLGNKRQVRTVLGRLVRSGRLLGAGEPEMAHKTDEFCYAPKIDSAVETYSESAMRWCKPLSFNHRAFE
ncbi:MAG TPA: hypothetical protein VF977_04940 [Candidatus Binatia bacterium]